MEWCSPLYYSLVSYVRQGEIADRPMGMAIATCAFLEGTILLGLFLGGNLSIGWGLPHFSRGGMESSF